MTSSRPALSIGLAAAVFLDHYWLKEELAAFCKAQGTSASGSKTELAARVAAVLGGGAPPAQSRARAQARMPSTFARHTVVEPGWRCSQDLRAFFCGQVGQSFRFDRFMRAQIGGAGAGHTLGDVLDAWKAHIEASAQTEIEPQFEYNRFVRAYKGLKPDAPHGDVVAAWREFRSMPASKRPTVEEMAARVPAK